MIIRSDRCPGRRSRLRRFLLAVLVTSLFVVGTVVVEALDVPGNDSVAAKLAEWGRGHGLNGVITGLEQVTYRQPPTGGLPVGGIPPPGRRAAPVELSARNCPAGSTGRRAAAAE
jgi:hypothetical protein